MSTEIPEPSPFESAPDDADLPVPARRPVLAVLPDLRAFAVTAVVSVILSIPVGALWVWLAPPVQGTLSQGSVYYTSPEGKSFIGQDGTLGFICLGLGLVLGALGFVFFRHRGTIGAALGLGAGGILGGYLATKVGTQLGPGHGGSIQGMLTGMANNTTFALPMQLRAVGMLWFWPLAATGLYFLLTLLLGPIEQDPQPTQEQAAWGQQQPWTLPPAAPAPNELSPAPTGLSEAESNGTEPVTEPASEASAVLPDEVDRRQ